jgi:hypothetical protein
LNEDRQSQVDLEAKQGHLEDNKQRQVDLEVEQRHLEEHDPDQPCKHSERT